MAPDVAGALARLGQRERWTSDDDLVFPGSRNGGVKYWIRMSARSGLKTTSAYSLVAQKTRRFPICTPPGASGGYCNGDAGTGPESYQILVGKTKGRTEECRRWRRGYNSRRTCDDLSG